MANWNLSVQLRGQGTHLARTLRQNAGHARTLAEAADAAKDNVAGLGTASTTTAGNLGRMARQARDAAREMRRLARAAEDAQRQLNATVGDVRVAVTLDNRTAGGIAQVRAALADLQRSSPVRLAATFDGQTGQIATTAAAVRSLRDDAQRLGTALGGLGPDATAAAAAFNTAQDAAQDLGRVLMLLRRRALATADALDELRDHALLAAGRLTLLGGAAANAGGHLNTLSGHTRTLRGDMRDLDGSLRQAITRLTAIRRTLDGLGDSSRQAGSGTSTLIAAAIALSTALIPVAAAAAPIALSLAAAGAGVSAFGAAVAGQIVSMTEAAEAQTKYEEAVEEHGKHSAKAAEAEIAYLKQIKKMPAATREASAAFSALSDDYRDWSDATAADTMPAFTKGFQTLSAALPSLTPIVQGAGDELDRLATIAAGAVASPGFDAFMRRVAGWSTDALHGITNQLLDLSRSAGSFDSSGGFNAFMDYARRNGPLVAETLRNLVGALANLLEGASEVGVTMLTVVNAFASLVNALPPQFISVVLQLAIAFKAARLAAVGLVAVTGASAVASLSAFVRAARFGGVAAALGGVAQRMTGVQKAAAGLGVLAVAALGIDYLADKARGAPPDVDKLTASLKRLSDTGKFTGELRKTFGDMDGLIDKAKKLATEADKAKQTAFGFRIPVLDDVADWLANNINDMTKGGESLTALKEDFAGLDGAMAQLASSGHADKAAADFEMFQAELKKAGYSTKEIAGLFPQYREAVASLKYEQELAAQAMGLFGEQAQSTASKLESQKASADGLRQAIQALNDVNRAALGGMIGFEAAIDTAAKAAQENAGSLRMVNGQLDLNSPKAQAAATALQDLGAKTDEAAGAARESGQSWEHVNGIYERGRQALVTNAMQMGLTAGQARALADQILTIPDSKSTTIEMRREDAIAGLNDVIEKIKATPGSKSVTVKALTKDAVSLLESVGFRTKRLPDGRIQVTAAAGDAIGDLNTVRGLRDGLRDKTITITTHYRITGNTARRPGASYGQQLRNADGSVTDYYADGGVSRQRGGMRQFAAGAERHVAQFAPAGSWRVWGEPETGGEAYIPLAQTKRPRSRAIAEETVRRLGGNPETIQWNAAGSVTDWRYDPNTGSLYSPTDAGQAGNKTKKVKGKEINYFSLSAVESKLKSTAKATRAWNKDLEKVADRVGGDVAEALAAMGKDGVALTKKMANGSTKYINQMAAALKDLAKTAKASLSDYTRQLTAASAMDATFQKNLITLAGRGYGDLAKQLAAQGDTAATELAAAAVRDSKKASAANSAAKRANSALTGDQVQQLVAIIAAVSSSKTGIHDVAAKTGLGEDEIVAIATKAQSQIKASLGSRGTKFLTDLARAQKGLSFASGGIRAGLYATRGGAVTFAEPSTGGEAYIPLGANKRGPAMNVLSDVASRFGVGLTDAQGSGRVVVIREQGPLVKEQHWHVGGGQSNRELARELERRDAYQLRRLARGGVGARR